MSHVILVAFEVNGDSPQDAQENLMAHLPDPGQQCGREGQCIEEWWIAEDQRFDRNSNESAVFIPLSMTQAEASRVLRHHPHIPTNPRRTS